MLNNSGTYGPNDASDNMVSSINGSQANCNDSSNNLNNYSKIMQQAASSASGNYEAHNFPYFGQSPMSIPTQMHPVQAYQSIAQSSAYSPQNSLISQENCSNNYLPAINLQSSQLLMMNFPQNFLMKNLSEPMIERSHMRESSVAKNYPLNIPQIPSRIFQKTSDLAKKVYTNQENEYDSSKEDTPQMSPEPCELNEDNDYVIPEDLSQDIKPSLEKVPSNTNDDPTTTQIALENSQPQHHYSDKNYLNMSANSPSPLITEKKRKSLEKTVRLIESILTKAINNNTKADDEPTMREDEPMITDPLEFSPKPNQTEAKSFTDKDIDSDDEVLIKKVPIKNKRKISVKTKRPRKSPDVNTDVRLNISIKQEIEDVNVKVEHVSWPDVDFAYPFLRDSNGTPKSCVDDAKFIGMEDSVKEAMEIIKNGQTSTAYFECPHCSLLLTHPKRFLVHTKWHTFGLLNEKRAEVLREREEKKEKRARAAEALSTAEVGSCDDKAFPCKDCDKVFITKSSMRSHRRKYHIYEQTQCRICLAPMAGQTALREHMATHEDAGAHQCPRCPKRFKFRHSLAKHADTHLEKTHGCPECSKMFGSALLVKLHMKTHERAARGTTYHCSYCGKGFYETYNLNVHERTHRNDKPFKCEICESRFVTNSSLTRHMKVSHSGAKPHVCKVCQKCFSTESIRDRHELRVHTDQQQFRYHCQMCPRRYMKLKDLKNHSYKMHPKSKRNVVVEADPNSLPDDVE